MTSTIRIGEKVLWKGGRILQDNEISFLPAGLYHGTVAWIGKINGYQHELVAGVEFVSFNFQLTCKIDCKTYYYFRMNQW